MTIGDLLQQPFTAGCPTLLRDGRAGPADMGEGRFDGLTDHTRLVRRPMMSALNFWYFSFKRKGQKTKPPFIDPIRACLRKG